MRIPVILLSITLMAAGTSFAQTSAFTYQGRLASSGAAATGNYQFEFKLFDAATGPNQIGTTQNAALPVQNGVFTTRLDFGAAAFVAGQDRWLEISVRNGSVGPYEVLSPRQQVNSVPFAVRSLNATSADVATNATTADTATTAGNVSGVVAVANGGTGSATKNFVDLTTNQASISGNKTFTGTLSGNTVSTATQYNINDLRMLSAPGAFNLFVGRKSGESNSGANNAFFGDSAGFFNSTGGNNSFFGANSGQSNTGGNNNAFFGQQAGSLNGTGSNNSFFGIGAGYSNISGTNNTIVGSLGDFGAVNLNFATAIGAGALVSTNNTIVLGRSADTVQIPGALSVAGGTTFGGTFGANIFNAATAYHIGGSRVLSNSGTSNLFVGTNAGAVNNGSSNVFVGHDAGFANTTGSDNAFFGRGAGFANTTGHSNSFFGTDAGNANTEGFDNSFFGRGAGSSNSTGTYNSFFGEGAGTSNTTGNYNSFFGKDAGRSNTTGTENSFVGLEAGRSNTEGTNNSFLGESAGGSNTTGNGNSFVGERAGYANTTGSDNTFVGRMAGQTHIGGNGNTFIGSNARAGNANINNSTAIGANAQVFLSNRIMLGTTAETVEIPGKLSGFGGSLQIESSVDFKRRIRLLDVGLGGIVPLCGSASDEIAVCSSSVRYKRNIYPFSPGLSLIKRLRPVSFSWRSNNQADMGLVAEEVNQVEPLLTTINNKGEVEGVKYDRVGVVLINAVNEQQAQIEQQQTQLKEQQVQLVRQQAEIEALKKFICTQNPTAEVCQF